ncbi:MAG: response regulator [Nitrospirae bacterium]|nr:response regulator [Nitrospirota bacterium]MBF0540232.1 response regulator [Nitrospirota bacterium]
MKKILIVDDEQDICTSLSEVLTTEGYSCVVAESGFDALNIYESDCPDIALMDMKMPKMSGLEVLIELKKRDEDFPVIMLTAYSEVNTAVAAIKHGAYDFIIKPANIENLLITINNAFRLKEILRDNKKLLAQQSKMASIGEMIGAIAHQWRQPLNSIALIVQDMEEAFDYGQLNKDYIHKNVKSTMAQIHYMSETIDDFRNFFRPDKEKVRFALSISINEVLRLVHDQLLGANISIISPTSQDLPPEYNSYTIGYPNEFKQVVLNIINNAKDAIVENRINVKNNYRGLIKINFEGSTDVIKIKISDNGGGISDEHIGELFKPYFTTKSGEIGTGIGLYLAKTIIENNMGGSLSVVNVNKEISGAEFIIELKLDLSH